MPSQSRCAHAKWLKKVCVSLWCRYTEWGSLHLPLSFVQRRCCDNWMRFANMDPYVALYGNDTRYVLRYSP